MKGSTIAEKRNLLQTIDMTEKNHPCGNCSYCLSRRVHLVSLPCQHSFCASCCLQIVKVSKIKKGLTVFTELQEGEEPLKCPKCAIVHIVTPLDKKMYEDVLGIEELKSRIRKKQDMTTQSLVQKSGKKQDITLKQI